MYSRYYPRYPRGRRRRGTRSRSYGRGRFVKAILFIALVSVFTGVIEFLQNGLTISPENLIQHGAMIKTDVGMFYETAGKAVVASGAAGYIYTKYL
jgi:hypothetical protein